MTIQDELEHWITSTAGYRASGFVVSRPLVYIDITSRAIQFGVGFKRLHITKTRINILRIRNVFWQTTGWWGQGVHVVEMDGSDTIFGPSDPQAMMDALLRLGYPCGHPEPLR